ncbi:hypothetical protein TWF679_001119 [Orbilia oligospora]|uniref:GH16 domain-containing protein n=2 Tax=Orbilia oligospora TaxID=2813651 RepID=A0A8H8UWA4_ORBOL|nr:hypothetical protein TWF679_001119 [Orbilia oligospora]
MSVDFGPAGIPFMTEKEYNETFEIHKSSCSPSAWNPRAWGRKRWAGALLGIGIIVAAIVVPLTVVMANQYPSYQRLEYSLVDIYSGEKFFESFDYGNGTEATHGFTNYVTKDGAEWSNLTYATSNEAIIRVLPRDHTGATGRPTVKILSKQRYTHGLFIFDIGHVPYGCGTWPAIWMSDTDPDIWPSHGEIDIIESVNQGNKGTQFTLHTTNGCEMSVKRKQTGKVLSNNCLNSTNYNMGCAVRGTPDSYGEELNKNQGGVYAMEWRTAGIRMWFFPRNRIPSGISIGKPEPSEWGIATADFPSTKCDINSHFKNHRLIINISLCGDWAGAPSVYNEEYGCQMECTEYVGIHQRRTWDPEGGKQSNCIGISEIYEADQTYERIVQIDIDQASHDIASGVTHPYTRSATALAFYADSTNCSTVPTIVILPEVADMQLRLCEDRRTEDDCQYQEFDLESLGYPWPQNILSFREVFPAYHPQKAVEANSLPSWDIESVFEGTGKPGFIDTEGWDTENAIDLSNLRLDDPLTLNGPEFLYEAIEGLE